MACFQCTSSILDEEIFCPSHLSKSARTCTHGCVHAHTHTQYMHMQADTQEALSTSQTLLSIARVLARHLWLHSGYGLPISECKETCSERSKHTENHMRHTR